jgi:hypothetical protein
MTASVQDAVTLLQAALASVQDRTHGTLGLRLQRAEVELELEVVKKVGADVEFKVFGLGGSAGAHQTSNDKQSIKLQLNPVVKKAALGVAPSDELAKAIIDLAADAKAVKAQVAGEFTLGEFTLVVSFGFTQDGKAAVIFGGEGSSANTHSITLTFMTA